MSNDREVSKELQAMVEGYAEAALWTSTSLAESTLSDEAKEAMLADCAEFRAKLVDKGIDADAIAAKLCWSDLKHGHNHMGYLFWLDRNRHGTGFWDAPYDLEGDIAERLTTIACSFGETDLYLDDDGKVYAYIGWHYRPPRG